MSTYSRCPKCGSVRLLEGRADDSSFQVPKPLFKFTLGATPQVLLDRIATACLDCGTVIAHVDPMELQKVAKRWMSDESHKKALRLE